MTTAANERVNGPVEVERCFCDQAAIETCACCHHPRCAEHLSAGLCARCSKAVDRAYLAKANTRWAIGTLTIVIAVVEGVLAGSKVYLLLALPLGILAAWSVGRLQHAHLVHALGARQAPTTGESATPGYAAFTDYGADAPFDDAYEGPFGYDEGAEHHSGGHDFGGDGGGDGHDH